MFRAARSDLAGRAPHVVIAGAGFAGLEAARRLAGSRLHLTVVDSASEFVFRPLLTQLLVGAVQASSVVHRLDQVVGALRQARFVRGTLEQVQLGNRRVVVSGAPLSYDYLILAIGTPGTGSAHAAPGMLQFHSLADCRRLQRAVTDAAAGTRSGSRERAFMVVGGGPLGVELAAGLKTRLDALVPPGATAVRVILAHQGRRLLEGYPEAAARYAHRELSRAGVEVDLGHRVTSLGDPPRPGAGTGEWIGVWAGGRPAHRLADVPGLEGVTVSPDLSVGGHPEVLVLGDLVALGSSVRVPALASAAVQAGGHAARTIQRDLSGGARAAFCYSDEGYGTYLGPRRAVVVVGGQVLTGPVAFSAKMALHLALSGASAGWSAEGAGRALAAIRNRLQAPAPRPLNARDRRSPGRSGRTHEIQLESRVAHRAPSEVFEVVRTRLADLFSRSEAPVLEQVTTPAGDLRMQIQLGGWLRLPIEITFDAARHSFAISTLAGHPLRASAVVALRADRDGTLLFQTNRYELGFAARLAGSALQLERRITSFWHGFHQAIRDASVGRGVDE